MQRLGMRYRWRLIFSLALLGSLLTSEGRLLGLEITVLSERELAGDMARAQDVRWAEGQAVYLSIARLGAVEYSLAGTAPSQYLSRSGHGAGELMLTYWLARSASHLGVASLLYEVGWRRHAQPSGLAGKDSFEFVEDIDLFGSELVVLGVRRDEAGRIAADAGIVWTADLERGSPKFRPLLFSETGPGAAAMDACALSELGAVRFLDDGSLVVVPGAEPDVFLLDPDGKLVHTWETEPLGIGVLCDHTDETRNLLSRDALARRGWINRFETVDEILPVGDGVGLITRRFGEQGKVVWRLVVLHRQRAPESFDLPFTLASDHAQLHADSRGRQAVFVLYQSGATLAKGADAVPSRLVLTEISP